MTIIKESKCIGDNVVQIISESNGDLFVRATVFGDEEFLRSPRMAGDVDALATYKEWVQNETRELAVICGTPVSEMPCFE